MSQDFAQIMLLDDREFCSAQHLLEVSGLSDVELNALIEGGVIAPVCAGTQAAPKPVFYLHSLVTVRTARRLRDDFELDVQGLILALTLLDKLSKKEAELTALRAQLSRLHW